MKSHTIKNKISWQLNPSATSSANNLVNPNFLINHHGNKIEKNWNYSARNWKTLIDLESYTVTSQSTKRQTVPNLGQQVWRSSSTDLQKSGTRSRFPPLTSPQTSWKSRQRTTRTPSTPSLRTSNRCWTASWFQSAPILSRTRRRSWISPCTTTVKIEFLENGKADEKNWWEIFTRDRAWVPACIQARWVGRDRNPPCRLRSFLRDPNPWRTQRTRIKKTTRMDASLQKEPWSCKQVLPRIGKYRRRRMKTRAACMIRNAESWRVTNSSLNCQMRETQCELNTVGVGGVEFCRLK